MINENIADFECLKSPFFYFFAFLKASFFSCFNSYYLLSCIIFGIKAWLLIVLTIKRSICLCLTLDWSKKKRIVLITKKNCSSALFIINNNDPQQWRPAINGASAYHSGRPTTEKTCTSVLQSDWPFNINIGHSQRSQVHADLLSLTTRSAAATTTLCLRFQISVTNHQSPPPLTRTPAAAPAATPPFTVPSLSATTTDRQDLVQQRHHRHHRPFPRTAGPKQNHKASFCASSSATAVTNHRR
jgi:hypothetical protein